MADVKEFELNNIVYPIKDEAARSSIISLAGVVNTHTTDIDTLYGEVGTLGSDIGDLQNDKQNKTDSTLQTMSKSVIGAINELKNDLIVKDITGVTISDNEYATLSETTIKQFGPIVFVDAKLILKKSIPANTSISIILNNMPSPTIWGSGTIQAAAFALPLIGYNQAQIMNNTSAAWGGAGWAPRIRYSYMTSDY